MTKEEILKGYSNRRIRDSWAALGSNEIKDNTKVYSKGILYLLNVSSSSLNGGLLYCKEDFIGTLNWGSAVLADSFSGEITFGNNILNPNLILILSSAELNEISEPIDENFVPFQEQLTEDTGSVIINDDDYQQCITCLGYPYITEEELEYSRSDICKFAIKPALEIYYRYFPRRETFSYPASNAVQEVPFPTGAYDILNFSVQQGPAGTNTDGTGNSTGVTHTLWRAWTEYFPFAGMGSSSGGFSSSMTGNYNSIYPPMTQTSTVGTYTSGRAATQAYINYMHRYRVDKVLKTDDEGNSQLYARYYTNKAAGSIEITFAMKDLNFNHVDYARRQELIRLCSAEVKKLFGSLRGQAKNNIPNTVDYSNWVSSAEEDIKAITTRWDSMIKYSAAIRGSL